MKYPSTLRIIWYVTSPVQMSSLPSNHDESLKTLFNPPATCWYTFSAHPPLSPGVFLGKYYLMQISC